MSTDSITRRECTEHGADHVWPAEDGLPERCALGEGCEIRERTYVAVDDQIEENRRLRASKARLLDAIWGYEAAAWESRDDAWENLLNVARAEGGAH